MNKHDLALAKKALAARQVKNEHKVSTVYILGDYTNGIGD